LPRQALLTNVILPRLFAGIVSLYLPADAPIGLRRTRLIAPLASRNRIHAEGVKEMDRRQFVITAALSPLVVRLASSEKRPEQGGPAIFPLVVGNTIPNQALGTGSYDEGLTQDQADTKFCQIVSRGIDGGQHLAVTKKFWNPSDWDTTENNLSNYASYGTQVIMALQPALPGTPTDRKSLVTFLAAIEGLGFNAGNCYIVLWQEPEVASKNISPTDFQNGLEYYGPKVASAGLPLVADLGSGAGTSAVSQYGSAAIAAYQAGCGLTGLAQDLYCPAYINQGVRLDTLANLADANNLPYGVFEHGCAPSQFTEARCTTFMNYIRTFMQTRQQASKPNLPVLYYDGQGSPTGENDVTSPIGQDPSTPSPDFRIALFQELWDA
jgi:hypothetical protein